MKNKILQKSTEQIIEEHLTELFEHGQIFPDFYLQLRSSQENIERTKPNESSEKIAALLQKGFLKITQSEQKFRVEFDNSDDATALQMEFFKRKITNPRMSEYPKKINIIIDENEIVPDRFYIDFTDVEWRKAISYSQEVVLQDPVSKDASAPSLNR